MDANPTSPQLDPAEYVALQVAVLHSAVRALHATHPDPPKVEAVFQQLIAQMQAHPAFLGSSKSAELLRQFAGNLFQPAVKL